MLKEGQKAPPFALESDGGTTVSLGDFAGERLVVYFYPKDDTPGCTREAQAFTAAAKRLAALGARVVGVSKDSIASHCRFRDKYALAFPLLSDPDLSVHKAYGAFGEKTMYGRKVLGVIRSTFLVGPDGRLLRVFQPVRVDGHADAVIAALGGGEATAATAKTPAKKATAKVKTTATAAPKRAKKPGKAAARAKGKR